MKRLLNDLYDYPNMKIYQYDEAFKFSLDSILLAEMVFIGKHEKSLLDLCTGNAVIPLVLSTKTTLDMYGIELQPRIYNLAKDSIKINHKEKQIHLICDSISNVDKYFPGNNFDIVTCNPPYFKYHHVDFVNRDELKQVARHEIKTNLQEVINVASYCLKDKGNFYLVHIPERLQEIMILLEQHFLFIKDLYFVYPKRHKLACLILIRATKRGKLGMKVHDPIFLDELSTYQQLFK